MLAAAAAAAAAAGLEEEEETEEEKEEAEEVWNSTVISIRNFDLLQVKSGYLEKDQ
ncbi:hypothetical protein STEG23_029101, partial [Scotinomys teguina]